MPASHNIHIRPLAITDTNDILRMITTNRAFLQPFDPIREESFFTYEFQRNHIEETIESFKNDKGYAFAICLNDTNTIIGRITLSAISRGPFQNAYMGYFIDQQYNGKGYATHAVHLAARFAFEEIDLHRIQAGVLPRNIGSIRVLEKNKFRYEGLAKRYLRINGRWEDHNLYAITREDWSAKDPV